MRQVKNLVKRLLGTATTTDEPDEETVKELLKDRPQIYYAFSEADSNFREFDNRIRKIEERNLQYYCRAGRLDDYVVVTGLTTRIPLTFTEYPQYGNMHDNVVENSKIFIRRSGVYDISASVRTTIGATAFARYAAILLTRASGILFLAIDSAVTGGVRDHSVATHYYCHEGDYIELIYLQFTGGNVTVSASYPHSPNLAVVERREDLDPTQYGLLNPDRNAR